MSRKNPSRTDEIVTIVNGVFQQGRIAGTSMAAVAATIGSSKVTLYSRFESAEELFHAVVEQMVGKATAAFGDMDLEQCGVGGPVFAFGAVAKFSLADETIALRPVVAQAKRFCSSARPIMKAACH